MRSSSCAARRRSTARLCQLRRTFAGDQDGGVAAAGARRSCASWRNARGHSPKRDLAELREFARGELGLQELQAWDIGYASEKLREERYAFSEQEVKQYFPEDAVLPGMFKLVETLYGLQIMPSGAPVWHDDVRFFDIRDAQGKLVGQFYLDLYARNSKRGGAWMDDAITRRRLRIRYPDAGRLSELQLFRAGRAASLRSFTHDEVITLFHEFGHGLHHLLTAGRRPRRVRHQRRGMGRGRTAQPVHGKLLLGMGRAARHDAPRRDRREAAARTVRQDARREEFPERPADPAPDRVRAVRHAAAQRLRAERRQIDRCNCSTKCAPKWRC